MKLLEIDPKTGKYKLSRRVLMEKPEGYVERERRPRPERGERRPRPERGERREGNEGRRFDNRNGFNQDGFDPTAEREPRDFNDSLDRD